MANIAAVGCIVAFYLPLANGSLEKPGNSGILYPLELIVSILAWVFFTSWMMVGFVAVAKSSKGLAKLKATPETGDGIADNQTLTGVLRALRERQATNPKDKSFAMHGVLANLGVNISRPANLNESLGKVYENLFTDLVRWQPSLVTLLVDVGAVVSEPPWLPDPDCPSWVPDWRYAAQRVWVEPRHIYGHLGRKSSSDADLKVMIQDGELTIEGAKIGSLTHTSSELFTESDLRTNLTILSRGLFDLRQHLPVSDIYDGVARVAFSILHSRNYEPQPKAYPIHPTVQNAAEKFDGFLLLFFKSHRDAQKLSLVPLQDDYQAILLLMGELNAPDNSDLLEVINILFKCMYRRQQKLFVSADGGHAGAAPTHAELGDEIVLLRGVPVPMIARQKREDPKRRRDYDDPMPRYALIGPAYVPGYIGLLDPDFDRTKLDRLEWKEYKFR
ncbi:hypothetical protein QBC37DRAFT_171315 [Rhypophila decipiens]|uniref:Uncharacterized protein n=1 Tax=Rhypophila decipiens TaxID=261697 RepID=A0AAN6Y7B2_9PEZI|nr:hypothetical protein QBC37DRAFT_171315 [Rhypophila decipiens]